MSIDFAAAGARIADLIARDRLSGVAVCACGPDGVAFARGYGFRDAVHAICPDQDTMFGIASMSKSITALALSILESEGKLSWDDPVSVSYTHLDVYKRQALKCARKTACCACAPRARRRTRPGPKAA